MGLTPDLWQRNHSDFHVVQSRRCGRSTARPRRSPSSPVSFLLDVHALHVRKGATTFIRCSCDTLRLSSILNDANFRARRRELLMCEKPHSILNARRPPRCRYDRVLTAARTTWCSTVIIVSYCFQNNCVYCT